MLATILGQNFAQRNGLLVGIDRLQADWAALRVQPGAQGGETTEGEPLSTDPGCAARPSELIPPPELIRVLPPEALLCLSAQELATIWKDVPAAKRAALPAAAVAAVEAQLRGTTAEQLADARERYERTAYDIPDAVVACAPPPDFTQPTAQAGLGFADGVPLLLATADLFAGSPARRRARARSADPLVLRPGERARAPARAALVAGGGSARVRDPVPPRPQGAGMIGVTGGTGNVGAELTRLLAARGSEFRVLAHRPETVPSPLGAGVVVPLDYGDPSTWAPALDGVRRLFLLFPLPRPRTAKRWMEPFVGAAADAGVEHVVYLTVPGADRIKRIPHHRVERAIERSGMSWTFLRCAYFMQNMHRRISTHGLDVVERDEVFVPAKRGLTTFLDARDAAEVALLALDDPEAHARLAHVLAGPETVGFDAMAAALGSALGREIRYAAPSLPAFWRRLRQRGVTWDVIFFMTIVYSLARRGRNVVRESETERLLGRRPTDLRAWAEASAWRFEEEAWT